MLRATRAPTSRGSSLLRTVSRRKAYRGPLLPPRYFQKDELNQTQLDQAKNFLSGQYVPWPSLLTLVGVGTALLVYIIGDTVRPLGTKFYELETAVGVKLSAFDIKLDKLETNVGVKLSAFDIRILELETKVDIKLGALESRLSSVESKLDSVESKLDTIIRAMPPN